MAPLTPSASAFTELQAQLYACEKTNTALAQNVDNLQVCCHELQQEVRQKTLSIEALRATIDTLEGLYQESALRCERLEFKLSALTYDPAPLYDEDEDLPPHRRHKKKTKTGHKKPSSKHKKIKADGSKKEKTKDKDSKESSSKRKKKKRRRRKLGSTSGESANHLVHKDAASGDPSPALNEQRIENAKAVEADEQGKVTAVTSPAEPGQSPPPPPAPAAELEEDNDMEYDDYDDDLSVGSTDSETSMDSAGHMLDEDDIDEEEEEATEEPEATVDKLVAAASEFDEDNKNGKKSDDDEPEIEDDEEEGNNTTDSVRSNSPPPEPPSVTGDSVLDEAAIARNLTDGPLRLAFLEILLERDQTNLLNLQLQRKLNQREKQMEELHDQLNFASFVSLRKTMPIEDHPLSSSPESVSSMEGVSSRSNAAGRLHSFRSSLNNTGSKPLKWLMKGQKISHLNTKTASPSATLPSPSSPRAVSPRLPQLGRSLRLRPFSPRGLNKRADHPEEGPRSSKASPLAAAADASEIVTFAINDSPEELFPSGDLPAEA